MDELKGCPFCGGQAKYYEKDSSIWCEDCPGGVQDYTISKEALFVAWNHRYKEPSTSGNRADHKSA